MHIRYPVIEYDAALASRIGTPTGAVTGPTRAFELPQTVRSAINIYPLVLAIFIVVRRMQVGLANCPALRSVAQSK
jgi:hypothetical protein